MTAESPADRTAALAPVAPVAPAAIVRTLVRPLTKILNPLMVRLAGRRFFPMAQIHHAGRRSGKAYVTPTSAHLRGDVLLIALTFGNQSDWSRNVRSAGGGTIRIKGEDYDVTQPQVTSRQEAKPLVQAAFSPMERAGLRILGIKQVMILQAVPAEHPPVAAATANAG
jgi:deazaflavin-dependent oxidoreductase (nitroreductase family)